MKMIEFNTINEIIENSSVVYKDRVAFNYTVAGDLQRVTFLDFYGDIRKAAGWILNRKIDHQNIVLAGKFSYQWLVVMFAILYSGNCCIPLNIADDSKEMVKKASLVKPSLVVCDKLCAEKLSANGELSKALLDDIVSSDKYFDNVSEISDVKPKDSAFIIFTSGTSGEPKAVVLSHKNITSNLKGAFLLSDGQINAEEIEVNMTVLPPHHAYQITIGLFYQYTYGGEICIAEHVKSFSKDIKYYQPTGIVVVPMVVELIYNQIMLEMKRTKKITQFKMARFISKILMKLHIDVRRTVFKSILQQLGGRLHLIHCGGAQIQDLYVKFFYDIGIDIFVGYGITECSPLVSVNKPKERRLGAVGKIMPEPYVQVRIVDHEIFIKGECVFRQYYNNLKATQESFQDEWFCTGDLGYIDSDGFLFITGRKKNLIILSNGENVSPEELENELYKISRIKECFVYEKHVNSINIIALKIYPLLKAGDYEETVKSNILKDIKSCTKTWPSYKQIKYIEFVQNEFEKNALGKVIRKQEN